MRASAPLRTGTVDVDGISIGYEVHGQGETTVLLMPTWTIVHSRVWKFQVPYLARHYRVVTFDGPGNGTSERTTDPRHYSDDAHAAQAMAVLDEVGCDRVVAVGVSRGGGYTLRLAIVAPHRVSAAVLVAPALPLAPPPAERAHIGERFLRPYAAQPVGWDKYNLAYWHDHYEDFVRFFFSKVFTEAYTTKAQEDSVGWALETTPAVLEAEAKEPVQLLTSPDRATEMLRQAGCPMMVVHGADDAVINHRVGVEAARLCGGDLVSIIGGGHLPMVKDPVRFNLALREFIERVAV
jgi:pimeloyl-ACP methyl ester carboxylesterase